MLEKRKQCEIVIDCKIKMKIESTCSYAKINLYSYHFYEVFISALPLILENINTHLKPYVCDLFNKMIECL